MASPRNLTWLVVAALLFLDPGAVTADSGSPVAQLPSGRTVLAAAWDGQHAYVFGGQTDATRGCCAFTDEIVRFDPTTNEVRVMDARLPTPRYFPSAVWAGDAIYVFGGRDPDAWLNEIMRYDPATDTLTVLDATLPSVRVAVGIGWDGTHVYLFGGLHPTGNGDWQNRYDDIVRFDPATETVTLLSETLPEVRSFPDTAWGGDAFYLFAGEACPYYCNYYTKTVLRYDPAAGTIQQLPDLPEYRNYGAAVWDGRNMFLVGGQGLSSSNVGRTILRYDLATGESTVMPTLLPGVGIRHHAAVSDGRHLFTFGGNGPHDLQVTDLIYRYDPRPPAPTDLDAANGPGSGQITLTWEAPTHAHDVGVTNYRIYRAGADGVEALRAEVGDVRTYVDEWAPDSSWVGGGYAYRVRAVAITGESDPSNAATVTPTQSVPCVPLPLLPPC